MPSKQPLARPASGREAIVDAATTSDETLRSRRLDLMRNRRNTGDVARLPPILPETNAPPSLTSPPPPDGAPDKLRSGQSDLQRAESELASLVGRITDPTLQKEVAKGQIAGAAREVDIERGLERGGQFFSEGALGRVDTGLGGDAANVLQARRDIAEQGFGAEAFQAAREQRLQGLQRSQQEQQRQLAGSLAAKGITGGLAGAQTLALLNQQNQERLGAERQLLLDEVNLRQGALGQLETTAASQRGETLGREQFNIGQKQRELQGLLSLALGEAGLGVAERGAVSQAEVAKEFGRAARSSGGGGKK